jgi:antitoxin ParD1/3/4
MSSINISLPETMRDWVENQVRLGGFSTASEFIRQLIREAQKQYVEKEIEAKLLQGLASGEATEMSQKDWQDIRAEVQRRITRRNRK